MPSFKLTFAFALLLPLAGCVAAGRKVAANEVDVVHHRMAVTPASAWKKLPASVRQTRWEEVWTLHGPQLDRLTLLAGLPEGKAVVTQDQYADQQVPVFRASMTARDLASMIEVSYRVQGSSVFNFESIEPVEFLGGPGIRLRYHYASGIHFEKRGSYVMRVIGRKLYALKLECVANPEFEAAMAEFDQLVASARLRD